jgi:hypothetical protein
MLLQGLAGYAHMMPGIRELDSARQRRDLSLVLRRRLTTWVAVGATGLTAVLMLIAATTAPGKPETTAPAATQPGANPTSAPIVAEPGLNPPEELPQTGSGGQPIVISGGS